MTIPIQITGADLTANAYDLGYSNIEASTLKVFVDGAYYHRTTDYAFSGSTITFVGTIFASQKIDIFFDIGKAESSDYTTTYQLSTPRSLTRYLGLLGTMPSKDSTSRDNPGTGDGTTTVFWLSKLGVLYGTYTLYYGASEASLTELTETTHYSIDLDTSKITLTSTGVTVLSTNKLYAEYEYNTAELLNTEMIKALNAAEDKVVGTTGQYFADFTATNPGYRKITNELKQGQYNPYDKVFETIFSPILDFSTTTNGDFTLGETDLVLTSASGLPSTGTLYVDGNKVAYTAKSTNTLTVPATTPSIDDGSVVRAEVIELSMEPEGSEPSYTVLTPDTQYKLDFMQGYLKILAAAYWGEIEAEDRLYPSDYRIRVSYMAAWHEYGENPSIPEEIEEVVNMIASKKFVHRIIHQKHVSGMNKFNAVAINAGDTEIDRILGEYTPLNVGTSMYNRQHIT